MSRAAAPARKASALIEALVDLDRRKTLDDLALNRLAREAQALMKSDATGARAVLGGVASIEGNVERVREHYNAALHRCRPIAQRQGMFADAGGSHAEVIEALTRSRKRKLQGIGYMLKLCRELRVKADHRIENDLTIQDAEAAKSHSDRIWATAEALDQAP